MTEETTEKPTISFEDFLKLDLRVGKVLEVADHPNADKLICLTIDLGSEQRQINELQSRAEPLSDDDRYIRIQIAVLQRCWWEFPKNVD